MATHTPHLDDRQLLRAHEPVVRCTAAELFLPTTVALYIARCSLWRADRTRRRHRWFPRVS